MALVADDTARDAADSPGSEVARKQPEVARLERGVAVPDEEEVSSPHAACEHPVSDDLRSESVPRPEEP